MGWGTIFVFACCPSFNLAVKKPQCVTWHWVHADVSHRVRFEPYGCIRQSICILWNEMAYDLFSQAGHISCGPSFHPISAPMHNALSAKSRGVCFRSYTSYSSIFNLRVQLEVLEILGFFGQHSDCEESYKFTASLMIIHENLALQSYRDNSFPSSNVRHFCERRLFRPGVLPCQGWHTNRSPQRLSQALTRRSRTMLTVNAPPRQWYIISSSQLGVVAPPQSSHRKSAQPPAGAAGNLNIIAAGTTFTGSVLRRFATEEYRCMDNIAHSVFRTREMNQKGTSENDRHRELEIRYLAIRFLDTRTLLFNLRLWSTNLFITRRSYP